MALRLENLCREKVTAIFPIKTVRICSDDKPFISAEIKKLDKYVKREYKAKGKSDKYIKLKQVYDAKFKRASTDFIEVA